MVILYALGILAALAVGLGLGAAITIAARAEHDRRELAAWLADLTEPMPDHIRDLEAR